ncbi:MAG TPA: class I poly(R)-hydroxyalkanoic acid synthase [Gammaproteobacteria bacterium]|nr:class I poly(R)-hydroxyalkanoic acid synthase [Gammaproteobacteria bacterium]
MAAQAKPTLPINMQYPAETLQEIAKLLRQLFDIYSRDMPELFPNELLQASHFFTLFNTILSESAQNPVKLVKIQHDCTNDLIKMFNNFHLRITTFKEHQDIFRSFKFDKRFSNQIWYDNPYFELLKRLYYLVRKYSLRLLYSMDELDSKTRQQLHFYIVNFLNFFAPTNYIWTNPEVMQAIVETGGNNLLSGLRNYLEDLVENHGRLNVRMTDLKAFKVGENLGVTKGKVIYQNELIQLIQYQPTTATTYKTPILITPPWINKYYVLDLSPNNSLVKWLVDQGFTVFIISWVNPDAKLSDKSFEDYMLEGPLQALDVVVKETKAESVHMVGYCIGGTLLACTLAYLQAKNDKHVKSATFLMSLINFSNPGEIGVFLDKPQIDALENVMHEKGYLNGRLLDMAFNTLRPNDLIWPYFIHNYLLGKPSKPFDMLYWNSDSTNQPYSMYNFYLRNMYLHNKLREPNGITLGGVPIDLSKIVTPAFFVASETDHITLWRSVFSGIHHLGGPTEFILSESGHVRAVVNPPTKDNKYGFKTNPDFNTAKKFKTVSNHWTENAQRHDGSWWPYWVEWLQKQDNEQIPAKQINQQSIVDDAPGSYVLKRI